MDFAKTWTGIIESLQGTTCREPQCEDDCNGILGGKFCQLSDKFYWHSVKYKVSTVYLADLVMSSPIMVLHVSLQFIATLSIFGKAAKIPLKRTS